MTVIRAAGAALASLALACSAVPAQQATIPQFDAELEAPTANSANPAPLPGEPVVSLNMPANPRDLLTGLYATKALIEVCEVSLTAEVSGAMEADEMRFLSQLGLDPQSAQASYGEILAATQTRNPDCAEGSADRAAVSEVVTVYTDALGAQ